MRTKWRTGRWTKLRLSPRRFWSLVLPWMDIACKQRCILPGLAALVCQASTKNGWYPTGGPAADLFANLCLLACGFFVAASFWWRLVVRPALPQRPPAMMDRVRLANLPNSIRHDDRPACGRLALFVDSDFLARPHLEFVESRAMIASTSRYAHIPLGNP